MPIKKLFTACALILLAAFSVIFNIEFLQIMIVSAGATFIFLYLVRVIRRPKRVKYVSRWDIERKTVILFIIASLLVASFITSLMNDVPLILDSAFETRKMKNLDMNNEIVSILKQNVDGDRVILAMHGYDHRNPITGSFENEFLDVSYDETLNRIEKSSGIFRSIGFDPLYFVAPGEENTDELKSVLSLYNITIIDYNFKEYTWLWRNMTSIDDKRFWQAQQKLEADMPQRILIHIQDYNWFMENMIVDYLDRINSTVSIRVDDVNPGTDPDVLVSFLNFSESYKDVDKVYLAVTPRFYGDEKYSSTFMFVQLISWRAFLILVVFLNIFFISVSSLNYFHDKKKAKKRWKRWTKDLPLVSIVIPMFNESKTVRKTMDHILKQTYRGNLEIVVIDDGSTDDTPKILAEIKKESRGLAFKNRKIKIIRQKNKGKPEALNRGMKESRGKIIVSTDGDSFLGKDSVELIVEKFLEDPTVGAVAGFVKVLNEDESWVTRFSQIEYIKEQMLFRGSQSLTGDVVICPGAFFAVRRFAITMNPSTDRTVVEDCDQTCMIRKSGWKVVYEPRAISETRAPADFRGWMNQRLRWFYGYLQVWNLLKKFSLKKPWMIYSYLGYPATFITFLIMGLPFLFALVFSLPSYFITDALMYLGLGISISLGVYAYVLFVLAPTKIKRSTIPWLLLFPVYELIVMVMRAYLYILYVRGSGPVMKYGPKFMRALPDKSIKFDRV